MPNARQNIHTTLNTKAAMRANIHKGGHRRVVIVGGGIAGLQLARSLCRTPFQVVLVDKNNYNQFPPLIYQVASAGLEPSSISFPFRRLFQGRTNFYFRMGEVQAVNPEEQSLQTSFGTLYYDYLVLAAGATTNFFGNADIERNALPMKTVAEAMRLRNTILQNLERAETEDNEEARQRLMNVVIVGGGPSGVEIAGALAEMKRTIVPRDYPDLDASRMHICLLDSGDRLLKGMDAGLSARAERDLTELGIKVMKGCRVVDCNDCGVVLQGGDTLEAGLTVWVSGVRASAIGGLPTASIGHAGRILTDRYCRVKGVPNVYAVGDQSLVEGDEAYPLGHPQLAQVAMQQAATVAHNLSRRLEGRAEQPFSYRNLGAMATIGRKKAVAEIGRFRFGGFPAWLLWLVVHLRSILGVRNKTVVFLNWVWNYLNYKQSLRLILRAQPSSRPQADPSADAQ